MQNVEGRCKSEAEIKQLAKQKYSGLSVIGKLEAKFPTTFLTLYFLLDKKCLPSDANDGVKTGFICWCPYCERSFEGYTKFVRHHDKRSKFTKEYKKYMIKELHEWDDGKAIFEKRRTWKEKVVTNGKKSAIENESIRHNGNPDRDSNKFQLPSTSDRKDDAVSMDVAGTNTHVFSQNGTSTKETSREINQKPASQGLKQSLHSTSFVDLRSTNLQHQNIIRQSVTEPSQTAVTSGTTNKSTMNSPDFTKEPLPTEIPLDLRAKKASASDQGQGDGQWKNEEKNHMEVDATVDEAEEEDVSNTI